eukprot:1196297-Prorocentrum_minimum.AAC.11
MFAWIPPLHVIVYCRFARVADENVYAGTGQGQGKGDPDPYGVRSPVALDSRAVVDSRPFAKRTLSRLRVRSTSGRTPSGRACAMTT